MRFFLQSIAFVLIFMMLFACGNDESADSSGGDVVSPVKVMPVIIVENNSQFVLYELRVHQGMEYLDSPNILEKNLEINETVNISYVGELYVTFIRDKVQFGERIAYTTAYMARFEYNKNYHLKVFDESFRFSEEG